MGMMAGPGVIDRIAIHPDTHEFDLHTIEEKPPKGICGSGMIDLAAHFICRNDRHSREICACRLRQTSQEN